jgi:hypothetical protein
MSRGDCSPLNTLSEGTVPVITTSESNNGVSGFYDTEGATLYKNRVTIPGNGSKYKSFYHSYSFAATQDVMVCEFNKEFDLVEMKLYFCAMFNLNSWRFSYFRKCTETKILEDLKIPVPTKKNGKVDIDTIKRYFHSIPEFQQFLEIDSKPLPHVELN